MSVWNQQKVYWQTHNVDINPIVKFTDDLVAEVAVVSQLVIKLFLDWM